jgi:hypothetical protein
MPPRGRQRLLATLRWVAGAQSFYDAPDSRDLQRVRHQGWAHDVGGRSTLTDDGAQLLEELGDGTESTAALKLALSTTVRYRDAKQVLELCGDYSTALAWVVARQADGQPMIPREPTE